MAKFDQNTLPEGVEINAEGAIQCTRKALGKLGNWCRENAGALAVAVFATASVNTALAQTTPASPSTSASAPADKGVGAGQYASNGDSFDGFLQKHGNGAIDEAGNMVDSGKWTEKDYDKFVKYRKESMNQANLSLDVENEGKKQAAIERTARIANYWADISQKPKELVLVELRRNPTSSKELLNFVIAKSLPPPGYATELLKLI